MEKLEFSLPEMYEKMNIIGKPTSPWNQERSGGELYNILKYEAPMGTYENLRKRMAVELLLEAYPEVKDLEKLREEFNKLRRNYPLPSLVRTYSFYEILSEAIKKKKEGK